MSYKDTAAARSQWYYKNAERLKKVQDRRRVKRRSMLAALKEGVPCTDCGVSYPSFVMDFDHVRGAKQFSVGAGALTLAWDRVLAEVEKCELVCANCHRVRTHERPAGSDISRQ